MENYNQKQTRKKFLGYGFLSLAFLPLFRFFVPKKVANPQTVKMLTQDGQLVEVNLMDINCGKRKMITDQELKTWVQPKK